MKTFISITITFYPNLEPATHYYYNDGITEIARHDMSVEAAELEMWKLVKRGGTNTFRSNPYNNSISYREVTFLG